MYHVRPEDPKYELLKIKKKKIQSLNRNFSYESASKHVHDTNEHDETTKDMFYVDASKFSSLLSSILHYLKLSNTYSIFILNPHSPVARDQMYGYRTGFSHGELELLYKVRKLGLRTFALLQWRFNAMFGQNTEFSVASYADAFKRATDDTVREGTAVRKLIRTLAV